MSWDKTQDVLLPGEGSRLERRHSSRRKSACPKRRSSSQMKALVPMYGSSPKCRLKSRERVLFPRRGSGLKGRYSPERRFESPKNVLVSSEVCCPEKRPNEASVSVCLLVPLCGDGRSGRFCPPVRPSVRPSHRLLVFRNGGGGGRRVCLSLCLLR